MRLAAIAASHILPPLSVSSFEVRVRDLPTSLNGFCIAQISDLHIGEGVWGPEHAEEASRTIQDAAPDVVVNTGDFLEGTPPWTRVEEELHLFSAPVTEAHRNLAILGNHDYVAGPEAVATLEGHLAEYGIDLLENRAICVNGVSFIGLTDEVDGFERAIEELLDSDHPRIGLIHTPDLAERLPNGSADLLLAGHTHGGQVALPFLEGYIVRAFCGSRYVQGMYRVNGNAVYVNRGLGCVGLPLRFRAAPEVTLIRLVR
jgi:predicted MPP superfamily phosphohydrolase